MILSEELIDPLTVEQLSSLAFNLSDLEQFVAKFDVRLLAIDTWNENPSQQELVYFFNDNLGGYTIKAIKNSLGGKVYYL
mgnify:FL=1